MALHEAKIVVSWYEFKTPRGVSRPMTQMEAMYRYGAAPGEAEMRAIDNLRDVYGIRRISFKFLFAGFTAEDINGSSMLASVFRSCRSHGHSADGISG